MEQLPATTTAPTVPAKRGAIVGTAPTWKICPWADQTLDVFGLNDGYILGVPRASAWFDLHPIPCMSFQPAGKRVVQADQVQVGAYLRPAGHLEWLKSRPFPVFLHDCRECDCASIPRDSPRWDHDPYPFPNWPNAQPFPVRAIKAKYGEYFSSTPAWMLAWELEQGYTEIHIYGIHLSTEWEYIQQRPNMEFLIGMALARGIQFVIPEKSSLLKGKHVYALEPKPNVAIERVERQVQKTKARGHRLQQQIAAVPWYRRSDIPGLKARLHVLDLELIDMRQEQARLQALAAVA